MCSLIFFKFSRAVLNFSIFLILSVISLSFSRAETDRVMAPWSLLSPKERVKKMNEMAIPDVAKVAFDSDRYRKYFLSYAKKHNIKDLPKVIYDNSVLIIHSQPEIKVQLSDTDEKVILINGIRFVDNKNQDPRVYFNQIDRVVRHIMETHARSAWLRLIFPEAMAQSSGRPGVVATIVSSISSLRNKKPSDQMKEQLQVAFQSDLHPNFQMTQVSLKCNGNKLESFGFTKRAESGEEQKHILSFNPSSSYQSAASRGDQPYNPALESERLVGGLMERRGQRFGLSNGRINYQLTYKVSLEGRTHSHSVHSSYPARIQESANSSTEFKIVQGAQVQPVHRSCSANDTCVSYSDAGSARDHASEQGFSVLNQSGVYVDESDLVGLLNIAASCCADPECVRELNSTNDSEHESDSMRKRKTPSRQI